MAPISIQIMAAVLSGVSIIIAVYLSRHHTNKE